MPKKSIESVLATGEYNEILTRAKEYYGNNFEKIDPNVRNRMREEINALEDSTAKFRIICSI